MLDQISGCDKRERQSNDMHTEGRNAVKIKGMDILFCMQFKPIAVPLPFSPILTRSFSKMPGFYNNTTQNKVLLTMALG